MSYEWVDHTAELELRLEAPTEEGLFADALAAFAELVGGDEGARGRSRHDVELIAPDRATLLAEWIGELEFLAESKGFVPQRAERLELSEHGLRATVCGRRGSPPHFVKAVTYHRLELGEEAGVWRGRVVLDV